MASASSRTASPVALIITGAWHTPSHYYALTHALTNAGFHALCPPLPTCTTASPTTATLATDVDAVRAVASDLAARGRPILAVMHSYGGVVGTEALAGLGWAERAARGEPKGGVVALVYMCAFVLPVGAGLCTPFGGQLPPIMVGHADGTCAMDDPWLRFFSVDVAGPPPPGHATPPPATLAWPPPPRTPPASSPLNPPLPPPDTVQLLAELTRHTTQAQQTAIQAAAYTAPGVDVAYMRCERDVALVPPAQDAMVGALREAGVAVVVESCQAGHSPHLSVPGEVAAVVSRAWARWSKANNVAKNVHEKAVSSD